MHTSFCKVRMSSGRILRRARGVPSVVQRVFTTTGMALLTVAVVMSGDVQRGLADEPSLAGQYGFLPVEVHKVTDRSSQLHAGDFNSDGRTDLLLSDNSKSRLTLLLQQSEIHEASASATSSVNAVRDSGRFEIRHVPVEHEVLAVTTGDFDQDGRTDVAYLGRPDRLVLMFQGPDHDWSARLVTRVPDAMLAPWAITAGPLLPGDGINLVVLGQNETRIYRPNKRKDLGTPLSLLNTSSKTALVQIADLDGDGASDLVYLAGDANTRVLCARFAEAGGSLGPEMVFDLEKPRAIAVKNIDGQPGAELLTIDSRTGRIAIKKVTRSPDSDTSTPARLVHFGLGKPGSSKPRPLTSGDLDGDGLTDILAADPETSRVLFFRQRSGSGLELGTGYPSLANIDLLAVGRAAPKGSGQLIVSSESEKSVGTSIWKDERVTFPELFPPQGTLAAMAFARFSGTDPSSLVLLVRDGKSRAATFRLAVYRADGTGGWEADARMSVDELKLEGTPEGLLTADFTGDGRDEVLVLQGTANSPAIYAATDAGLKPLESKASPLAGLSRTAVTVGTWKGRSVLVSAQNNFVRLLGFDRESGWQVIEQVNSLESNARVLVGALIQLDGEGESEVALVDQGAQRLKLYRYESNRFVSIADLELGDLTCRGARVADLNGDGREDLLLEAADRFAVLYSGGRRARLTEIATFESSLDRIYPTDVLVGDLNGDGRADVAITDVRAHFLEILRFDGEELKHALYFKVFESKLIGSSDNIVTEPREGLIADVTGDGLADVVLLAHDRVLVYPQDAGAGR